MHHIRSLVTATLLALLAVTGTTLTAGAAEETAPQATEAPATTPATEETAPAETTAEAETTQAAETTTTTAAAAETAPAETTAAPAGWFTEQGKRYYRNADGSLATGEAVIDGTAYLFGCNGALKTGWQTVEGERRFFDPETGAAVKGWLDFFDQRFYIGENGKVSGLQTIDCKTYYFSPDTGAARFGLTAVGDTYYCFSPEDGLMKGNVRYEDSFFPLDPATGELLEGWFQTTEGWHYFSRERMDDLRCSFLTEDGKTYYFSREGTMLTGLQPINGTRYLFDRNGVMQTGWLEVDDVLYYFRPDGRAGSGFEEINGVRYYFLPETNQYATGLVLTPDGMALFDEEGHPCEGWYTDAQTTYYFVNGLALTNGWYSIDDLDFKFDEIGRMISDGRLYNQFDPKWKEVTIGTASSSMYESACGIFSFCNAIFRLNGNEADAVEVAEWAYSTKAYRPGGGGTYREIFYAGVEEAFGEQLQFTLGAQVWGGVTDERLIEHLTAGGVAVIHVSGHFMAICGYDPETGLYRVLESAISKSRSLPGDSWQTAAVLSKGKTKVDWFVLISSLV